MTNEELCSDIIKSMASYNRRMYNYGKDYRTYGTDHLLRVDQIQIITIIGDHPNLNLRTLAEMTDTSVPTLSFQVNRLVSLNLLCKKRAENSQREIVISLTGEGKKAFDFHKDLDDEFFSKTIDGLKQYTSEELTIIKDFMKKLEKDDLVVTNIANTVMDKV